MLKKLVLFAIFKNGTGVAKIRVDYDFPGEEKEMKVLTNLKVLVMISSLMMIMSACGKQTQSILGDNLYNTTYGSCNTAATGANVYTGTISDNNDLNWSSYGITTGTIKLNVTPVNGTISGQFYASAIMTLNGAQYCCSSQGLS
ncbi:MAG: hypothetical protein WCQ47_08520, partial [bacterium]